MLSFTKVGVFDTVTPGDHTLTVPTLGTGAHTITWVFKIPDENKAGRICLFGDLATVYEDDISKTPALFEVLSHHLAEFDSIVHIGDVGYNYAGVGDHFNDLIDPVSSARPYTFAVGNHEYWLQNGDMGGFPVFMNSFRGQMHMSDADLALLTTGHNVENIKAGNYVTRIGKLTLIVLNTECLQGNNGSWQDHPDRLDEAIADLKSWLLEQLIAVDRNETPWVATVGHRPFWWDGSGLRFNSDMYETAAKEFIAMYDTYVDFHFSGHTHAYARCESPNDTFQHTTVIDAGLTSRNSRCKS